MLLQCKAVVQNNIFISREGLNEIGLLYAAGNLTESLIDLDKIRPSYQLGIRLKCNISAQVNPPIFVVKVLFQEVVALDFQCSENKTFIPGAHATADNGVNIA